MNVALDNILYKANQDADDSRLRLLDAIDRAIDALQRARLSVDAVEGVNSLGILQRQGDDVDRLAALYMAAQQQAGFVRSQASRASA